MQRQYSIDASYRLVRRISRRSGSNFYRSFWLLPKPKRKAMTALYAFARVTDDLGDCDEPVEQRTLWLKWWRNVVQENLTDMQSNSEIQLQQVDSASDKLQQHACQILPALRDASRKYSIPTRYLLEIIDGVLADQQKTRFDTYEQLEHYCYLVASAVGLACLHIWEFEGELPEKAAVDCGIAFQLTNILRDISEDAQRGRIYLPRQHYLAHGLCEDDLLQPRADDRLAHLINEEIKRAEKLYESGWQIWDTLSPDGKPMFSMMWRTYRRLLTRIADNPREVFHRRLGLSNREKIGLVSQHFLPPMFKRLEVPPAEIALSRNETS
ncbi:phytoene/squalene synthase family protein [Planctomycetes bacterium K23_9]|uniref:All-trans-phytoene synthase n=1 Tax=Stieleria marina TaxID=1930275 RepID=A0A517NNR7_9BACT|nr:All-trans-phytoene synthase [Planctomycetes bacterium K23_9]